MIREYLLSTDNFTNPKVIKGVQAVGILIIRLLLLVPGTNPLRPAEGVGIGSTYRFITSDELSSLSYTIEDQLNTYMPPEVGTAKVSLDINNNSYLVIKILINDTEFIFDTESSKSPVRLSTNS